MGLGESFERADGVFDILDFDPAAGCQAFKALSEETMPVAEDDAHAAEVDEIERAVQSGEISPIGLGVEDKVMAFVGCKGITGDLFSVDGDDFGVWVGGCKVHGPNARSSTDLQDAFGCGWDMRDRQTTFENAEPEVVLVRKAVGFAIHRR